LSADGTQNTGTAESPDVGSNFMATLQTFEGIEQFVFENQTDLKNNYLIFRQLLSFLGHINQGKIEDHKLFNINENGIPEIICLQTKLHLLLIPIKKEVSSKAYELLKSIIKPNISTGVEILGERTLVLKIIKDCNAQFNVIKDRLFCECEKTMGIRDCEGSLQIPMLEDIEEITEMEISYHKEEYGDKSNCDFQETKKLVEKKFENQSILLWKNKSKIVSLINANIEGDLFYINHIYTKPTERKKGFGTNLLQKVTSKIIDSDKIKAGLVSQRLDSATNKIFNDIGFAPIYEMLDVEIS